jgi:hypothetical protein
MRRAVVLALSTLLSTGALALAAQAADSPAGKAAAAADPSVSPPGWKTPRTAWGAPDLSGSWTNATMTPLTRNPKLSSKSAMTPQEAKDIETLWTTALNRSNAPTQGDGNNPTAEDAKAFAKLLELRPDFAAAGGDVGGYNTFWIDPGTHINRVNGEYRTSIITTANGLPPSKKPGAPAAAGFGQYRDDYTSYETRSLGERCIMGFGRNAGPPMLPNGYYNNGYAIQQTPNEVLIQVELIHDTRVVRLNGKHRTDGVRPWMGDSIGHWEGDTLVVETTNIPERQNFMGSWRDLKVTEWFTRVSDKAILYRFQVEDPSTWEKPWGGEYTFSPYGRIYEYACHEGNYALPGILSGARYQEKQAAEKDTAAKAGGGN